MSSSILLTTVSYFIIGLSLLYPNEMGIGSLFNFNSSAAITSEQRIVLLSRGSYACMNLIFALTNALNIYSLYVTYQGYLHRVEDILPRLDVLYLLLCNHNRWIRERKPLSLFSAERLCACWTFLTTKHKQSEYSKVGSDEEGALEEGLLLANYTPVKSGIVTAKVGSPSPYHSPYIRPKPTDRTFLHLQHFSLTLKHPTGVDRRLVENLTMTLDYGMRLLITGDSIHLCVPLNFTC